MAQPACRAAEPLALAAPALLPLCVPAVRRSQPGVGAASSAPAAAAARVPRARLASSPCILGASSSPSTTSSHPPPSPFESSPAAPFLAAPPAAIFAQFRAFSFDAPADFDIEHAAAAASFSPTSSAFFRPHGRSSSAALPTAAFAAEHLALDSRSAGAAPRRYSSISSTSRAASCTASPSDSSCYVSPPTVRRASLQLLDSPVQPALRSTSGSTSTPPLAHRRVLSQQQPRAAPPSSAALAARISAHSQLLSAPAAPRRVPSTFAQGRSPPRRVLRYRGRAVAPLLAAHATTPSDFAPLPCLVLQAPIELASDASSDLCL
jgi:hypothetical protein